LTSASNELECVEESSLEFETGFHRLLDALRQTGRVAIINTPPCPLGGGQGHSPQQLVRLEAIRGCTLESSALLVDQWAHWERHAAADWVRSSGVYPVDRGAVELAREFIQELQLDQLETTAAATADPDSAVVPPVPV
jgi:hypothetical protein